LSCAGEEATPHRSGRDDDFIRTEEDSDAALVARARLGDEAAFTELYRLHSGYVRGIGRNILRDDSVDDLCQDTFLLAFTRLDSFAGTARFRSWLTRIAINQCMIALRKRRYLVPIKAAEDALDQYFFANTDASLQGAPARMDLEKMMKVLTPLNRRILVMSYLEGIPEQEIAEVLGLKRVTVANRLRRAKRRMRDTFS
jgi:RNA polymerase sigma-70 factor (ECF subfamily)